MRIFKNTRFDRFAHKAGIGDDELKGVVIDLENKLYDADLGGGVYKQRLAREGESKRRGYRAIIFFKSGDRTFFVYGYEKKSLDNISEKELKAYKNDAKKFFTYSNKQLEKLKKIGQIIEFGKQGE